MAAGCIQESCIYERCLTPEDSAAAIGNSIPLRSTPFPIAEPYSKFSVFFDYTFLDNSRNEYQGIPYLMDKAYEGDKTRKLVHSYGHKPVVPPKKNRLDPWEYDIEL